ncbi:MAG: hypothetical protein QM498_14755 [Desulfobacterium sp.]
MPFSIFIVSVIRHGSYKKIPVKPEEFLSFVVDRYGYKQDLSVAVT